MAEQQLVDYIKKARQAGQQDGQSRSLLIKNGWTEVEVNEAFLAVNQSKPQPEPEPQAQVQPQPQTKSQPRPQLLDYINKARRDGMADEQSRSFLIKNGWTDEELNDAFTAAKPAQSQPAHQVSGQPEIRIQPQAEIQPQYQPQPATSNMPQKRGGAHFILKFLIILILIAVIGGGGFFAINQFGFLDKIISGNFFNVVPVGKNGGDNSITTLSQPSFAQYSLEKTKYVPVVPNYEIDLTDLSNLGNFQEAQGYNFSLAQTNSLLQDNFFIQANYDKFYSANSEDPTSRNDDWTALYKQIGGSYNEWERQPENSVFITSDFVLHVFHKIIAEEFSYIEETNFYPTLADLSNSLLKSSSSDYTNTNDQDEKDSYERLSAYFLVSSAILDNASEDYNNFIKQNYIDDTKADTKENVLAKADALATSNNVSDNAKNIAKQEIELIFDSKDIVPSPLMGKYQPNMPEDYTQFAPRSYYTKNVILRNYFRAMMWYGRMNFLLKSTELTRDAANITLLLSSDEFKKWESIYLPTSFFVGQADDLTVYDYTKAEEKSGFTVLNESDSVVNKLQNELLNYKNPQIMSSVVISPDVSNTTKEDLQNTTKGFRFMGQRFTPDAFIFSTLTQGDEAPDPKTGQKLPSTPTALMVSTLMGSNESSQLLDVWIKANAPDSDKVIADRMNTLQSYFNKTTQQQWTQNIYWSWLYTIKSLFQEALDKTGYPVFMKSDNWNKKNLQGFLGSWTELKHDTLLYAKQSYAEMGAGPSDEGEAQPIPKGYVEPNIGFFDRLIALVNLSKDGLNRFGILPSLFEARNNAFLDALKFYRKIAVAELQNQTISDEDFEKLRLSAGQLDSILSAPDSQVQLEKNARSAIIADVHTDVKKQQILYEADGIPNYIYVAVEDANGTRLTKGLVYSYYEFTDSLGKRLDDQTWQKWNYSDTIKLLKMPDWNKSLIK